MITVDSQPGGKAVVRASGYIDAVTAQEIEKALRDMRESGALKIVLDCSSVQFVSAAGWAAILRELKELRTKGGDMIIAAMNSDTSDLFALIDFSAFMRASADTQEALEALG